MDEVTKQLLEISKVPAKNAGHWLSSAEDSVEFLKKNGASEWVVMYASLPCVFIHTVLAPLKHLDPPDHAELRGAFVNLDTRWAIEHASGGGEPDRVYLSSPLQGQGKTLRDGEKLIFFRSFAASSHSQFELSQKLVHALDVHYVEERKAFCRLDENGDLFDVIKIVEERTEGRPEDITVVAIRTKNFAEYMRLSGMGMVVIFDFTRTSRANFNGWKDQQRFERSAPDLFYDGGVMLGQASYAAGRQIVRPAITLEDIVKEHMEARNPSNRQYAVFKAINLKTKERIEVSCDPKGLSNYFQPESNLPLELSPVFFRSEVLLRYKADPDKYELRDRSVYCRGTWGLQTYDINDAGQVHTYLRYLRDLPYSEQVYWQSFNEWPKGGLSNRAITTDFEGEVYREYDPLNSLKRKVAMLDETRPEWWSPRGEALAKALRYPVTTSAAEWANEILALDQLVGEGFRPKPLRAMVTKTGRELDKAWGSFKLMEECLLANGAPEDEVKNALQSIRTVRDLRNVLKGHGATDKRTAEEKLARTTFGTFRAHFARVCAGVDQALDLIIETLETLSPTSSPRTRTTRL
jgi:hypothetical protein